MRLDKDGLQIVLNIILPQIEDNKALEDLITNSYTDKFNRKAYSILYIALNKYISNGFKGNYEYFLERNISKKKIELENKLKKESEKAGKKFKGNEIELNDEEISMCVDSAMREAADLIYNTFKYQLVKYLGVFNLMYKYFISKIENKPLEETSGIDILLIKLEYNAFSEEAKIASDYGVPNKIVAYYDAKTSEQARNIQNSFDSYERNIFEKVKKIIEK